MSWKKSNRFVKMRCPVYTDLATVTQNRSIIDQRRKYQQHIVNRFSDAAKNFGLTISLEKTEVLYQPPPREAYGPPHFSINGTNLNAVE